MSFILDHYVELMALLMGVVASATAVTAFVAPRTDNTVDDKVAGILSKVMSALKFISLRLGK